MRKIYLALLTVILPCISYAQIPTMDMESWRHSSAGGGLGHTAVTVDVPTSWYGSDSLVIALGQGIASIVLGTHDSDWRRQVFEESTIVHGPSHSAKIMTQKEDTFHIAGVISNAVPSVSFTISPPGLTGISLNGGSPVSVKPTSVSAWVRYKVGVPRGTFTKDSGRLNVQALAHVGGKDSVIGNGTVTIGADTNWYQVTATLVYIDTVHPVDTIRVAFFSSGAAVALDSSTLYVDDISMASVPNPVFIDHTGVNEISGAGAVKVFPNPSAGMLYIDAPLNEELTCKLYALNGQEVVSKTVGQGHGALDIFSLPDGMYFYDIQSRSGGVVQRGKVVLNR